MTTTTTTPTPCIPPKIPTTCAPMCEEKCHYLGKCDTVVGLDGCVPGCVCPNGTVWNGTTCTTRDQCLCKDENGNIHEVGSSFIEFFL